MPELDLIAAMTFGLESVVADELRALGYRSKVLGNGRVLFRADLRAMVRANLWLRTADRVLLRLGTFPAADFGQLFDGIAALPWEEWLPADAAVHVNGRSVKSQLSSVPACQKVMKKAIVERLRMAHRVASLPETGLRCVVEVSLLEDQATLTLDTTGQGLNKRGYRTLVGEAQLRETLAAAMVLLCGWRPEQPLLDPFCGTGTIPIEAALLGRNLAPGRNRTFAAEAWPTVPTGLWREARREADDLAQPALPQRIVASDIDQSALRQARYHARQAGVEADIHFQQREFTDLSSSRQRGLLLCNPPYGERLATRHEVEVLYRAMPAVFSRLPTWSFGVLTSHARFERLVGHKAASRRKLYNGQIECRLYHYINERSQDPDAKPLFDATDQRPLQRYRRAISAAELNDDAQRHRSAAPTQDRLSDDDASASSVPADFINRLVKRARHLRKWPARGVTCYRLYDRDIPAIPLEIDRYEQCLHLAERPRPHERTLAEHHRWLDQIAAAAGETLGVDPASVFLKRYSERRERLAAVTDASPTHLVQEGGLKYHVNLTDFEDTGLPLDLRPLRNLLRTQAAGKRVLLVNGNTGTLAVAAAAAGAASVQMIDPLEVHVRWARLNFAANDLESGRHEIVCGSPEKHLPTGEAKFDLAVIEDPPPDEPLLAAALQSLAAGGYLYVCTHDRRYRPPWPEAALGSVRDILRLTVPEDFRQRRVHRTWRVVAGQ